MIALYLDENVEGQITRGLRARGLDVLTAEEDDHGATPETQVLDRATALGRVAFSRDQDFLREATQRQRTGIMFAGVIYAHKMHVSIGQCVDELELLAKAGEPEDFANRVYFLTSPAECAAGLDRRFPYISETARETRLRASDCVPVCSK